MSKGSQRRPEDSQRFREGWERIFSKPVVVSSTALDAYYTEQFGYSPFCRDPQNCNGSCRRDPACND